jgi:hypothetical protein
VTYGIRLAREPAVPDKRVFARNELAFVDPTGCDHELFGPGLRRALYNFMHGVGLEEDVRRWFAPEAAKGRRHKTAGAAIPKPRVPADLIRRALANLGDGVSVRQSTRRQPTTR